jgi:hypothetical protein
MMEIKKISSLRELDVSHCVNVTPQGLAELLPHPSLQRLVALGTQITQKAASDWVKSNHTKLRCLQEIVAMDGITLVKQQQAQGT